MFFLGGQVGLTALYAACGCGRFTISADMLEMKIMLPPCTLFAIMFFAACWAKRKEPVRLICWRMEFFHIY